MTRNRKTTKGTKGTNPIAAKLQAVNDLDRRRQVQIAAQVEIINRLMVDGTYDVALQALTRMQADNWVRLQELREAMTVLYKAATATTAHITAEQLNGLLRADDDLARRLAYARACWTKSSTNW